MTDILTHLDCDFEIVDIARGGGMNADAFRRAVAARKRGLRPHVSPDRRAVLITHGNSAAFLIDLFAVWQAGGVAVCLSPTLTAPEVETVRTFTDAACTLPSPEHVLAHSSTGRTPTLPEDAALILFTSGTTGAPKGVVHTHGGLAARVRANLHHMPADHLARTLSVLPTHFGHGLIGNCLTPMAAGARLHLFSDTGVRGAAELAGVIDDHGVTFMSSVPSLWNLVLRLGRAPTLGSLCQVSIGSAPLSAKLWNDVGGRGIQCRFHPRGRSCRQNVGRNRRNPRAGRINPTSGNRRNPLEVPIDHVGLSQSP